MIRNSVIFVDFETGSKNPYKTQPTQLASIIIDIQEPKIIPNSEFNSLIKPEIDDEKAKKKGLDPLEEEALEITNLSREELAKAPNIKTVWQNFTEYIGKYNKGNSQWGAPICSGMNIKNFDCIILDRIAGEKPWKFGPYDKKRQQNTLFHPVITFDLLDDFSRWFAHKKINRTDSISMDSMREFFGLSTEKAHDALTDVVQGGELLVRFLKLYKFFFNKVKWK